MTVIHGSTRGDVKASFLTLNVQRYPATTAADTI